LQQLPGVIIMMQIVSRWLTIVSLLLPALVVAESKLEEYRYGRFQIENQLERKANCLDSSDRDCYRLRSARIIGGEFVPPALMPQRASNILKRTGRPPAHIIFINYESKELLYYRRELEIYIPVVGYAVVTPDASTLPRDVVRGEIRALVKDPTWCPQIGGEIRRDNPHLPPGCLPPGHPLNMMGDWRFDIDWSTSGWELIKLHGARGYPRHFEQVNSYGCTQLENKALGELVRQLGGEAVREGIEVVALQNASSFIRISD